jgi:tetratricopeptide (TPR) repeat protein
VLEKGRQNMADYWWLIVSCVVVLLWVVVFAVRKRRTPQPKNITAELLVKAGIASSKHQWEEAARICDHILRSDPQSSEAYLLKGIALVELDRVPEAKKCCERAEKLGNPNAASVLAECRKRLGESGSGAWLEQANAMLAAGRFREALALTQEAADSNPTQEQAWFVKGNALHGLGNNDEALACYDRVIALNKGFPGAWNNKGWLLTLRGEEEEALTHFRRAVELNPRYADAWLNMGAVLMEMWDGRSPAVLEDALRCLQKAKALGHLKADAAIATCQELLKTR